jgi:ATP-dependent exoDNAse (exonuclease V) alpha subunit
MAIFHLTAKMISRGKGQSAIAAAAYRSGERLRDEQADEQKFYTSRAERIVFTDIMAPAEAPEWAHDRNALWNHAERAEKRKDAQLAREIEVALPHEMTDQQREYLVKDFAREAFVRKGYAVDIAIHAPDKNSDERNHHAHLMVTRRTLGPDGFAPTKDWQFDKKQLGQWREQFAHLTNRHLERHGIDARVDHRSLKEQGIEREPTVHVGYAGMEIAARGGASDRYQALQDVMARNDIRVEMKALDGELRELGRLDEWEKADAAARAEADRQKAAEAGRRAAAVQTPPETPRTAPQEARASTAAPTPSPEQNRSTGEFTASASPAAGIGKTLDEIRPVDPSSSRFAATGAGLRVVDSVSGTVTKLGDFVLDFLAGSPPPQPKADMRGFVTDPAARKQQQLARLASTRQAQEADKALESIREDMQAGRNLKSEDIKKLTRQHQEQIKQFGDEAVRQMVDEAQKRAERYWKGDGRERERD